MNDARSWGALAMLVPDVLYLLVCNHGLSPADYLCWAEAWPPLQRLKVPCRPATRRDWVLLVMQHGTAAQVAALGTRWWPREAWDLLAQWRGFLARTDMGTPAYEPLDIVMLRTRAAFLGLPDQLDQLDGFGMTALLTDLWAQKDYTSFARLCQLLPPGELVTLGDHVRLVAQFIMMVHTYSEGSARDVRLRKTPTALYAFTEHVAPAFVHSPFRPVLRCTPWCTATHCVGADAYCSADIMTMGLCSMGRDHEHANSLFIEQLTSDTRWRCVHFDACRRILAAKLVGDTNVM